MLTFLNTKLIANFLGILLLLNSAFMAACLPVAIYYGETVRFFIESMGITALAGLLFWKVLGRSKNRSLGKRDGFLIVTLGWLVMALSGMLPYVLGGHIPGFTNAFFETISGYTTTGSTILDDIESLPKSVLLWRSLTQWIGGMGIIVLAIAILPALGIGGMQLFAAEAPGIAPDKLKPRIRDTAARLWIIYVGFTALEAVLLTLGGMSFYDALNHALTTMSSGGFSTKQESIGFYDRPFIQYTVIAFMLVAGSNFAITYYFLKAQFSRLFLDEEFRYYVLTVFLVTLAGFLLMRALNVNDIETDIRFILFHVVSVVSTTGFTLGDYTGWSSPITFMFFMIMFLGASSGSTAGGVKIVRHLVLLKTSGLMLRKLLHPSAVLPVRIRGKMVRPDIISQIYAFVIIYLLIFAVCSLVLAFMGIDMVTAVGAAATALGNIGPGMGLVGPAYSFNALPVEAKWVLSVCMLIGRLELFTVLVLCTPYFWRSL